MQMKGVILDKDTFGVGKVKWDAILDLDVDWQVFGHTDRGQVNHRISKAQIILTNKVKLDKQTIAAHPNLQYIGVLATGMNNVDVAFAEQQGITVTNVEGYGTASVVQHTIMLMLNLITHFNTYQQQVRQGEWSRSSSFCLLNNPIQELADKHLVIIGYGELGKGVAKLADAFGMKVSVAARHGCKPREGRERLEDLLPSADFVSLHCVASDENYQLFNRPMLARMKKGAFLINTARGSLVNSQDLLEALKSGHLGGAAVDVLEQEPPPKDHPLLGNEELNLIITPHNAWGSVEARQRLLIKAGEKVKYFLTTKK